MISLMFGFLSAVAATNIGSNIIIIVSDDQDIQLGGLTPLVKTQQLLGNAGATFTNAFVTTPLCCPSRSSLLTGLYLHNHGTVNNSVSGGCSSQVWQHQHEPNTFAATLHGHGYKTFYAGKYLNQYGNPAGGGVAHVPDGWDWWIGLVGNSRYYNYTLSVNGTAKKFTDQYLTDLIKDYSLEFIEQQANSKFLMVIAPPAPHAPFTAAPEYQGHYSSVKAMKTPSFNVNVAHDKHWLLRMSPSPLPDSILPTLDEIYRSRWETLLSVDDLVEAVIKKLNLMGLFNNTYILYTSDHGYHIGQFSLPWDKRQPYEFDIRVPLMMCGPGISAKQLVTQPVLNIDLAPTILEMADVKPPAHMDGLSFLPFAHTLNHSTLTGRTFLIEYRGEGDVHTVSPFCQLPHGDTLSECSPIADCKCQDSWNNTYSCVRHLNTGHNLLFCKFDDSEGYVETYDMNEDPYQLHNMGSRMDNSSKQLFTQILQQLKSCQGQSCILTSNSLQQHLSLRTEKSHH